MTTDVRKTGPKIVVRNGRQAAVILDIDHYRDTLERLEDLKDLKMLEEMRKKPLKFQEFNHTIGPLSDFSDGTGG